MPWYYVKNKSERVGPFDDAQFQGLVSSGEITPDTHVWRDGMANWLRYGDMNTGVAVQQAHTMMPCAQCGITYGTDEMLRYGDQYVCAMCKTSYFQRLREGVPLGITMNYAGFWIRVAAALVDGLIMGAVSSGFGMVFGGIMGGLGGSQADLGAAAVGFGLNMIISTALGIAYDVFFIGTYGATPGKMACGLRVVRANGSKVGYLLAFGRYWGKVVSSMTMGIGFLMVAFDDEKRGLHDRICNTRVVTK